MRRDRRLELRRHFRAGDNPAAAMDGDDESSFVIRIGLAVVALCAGGV